MNFKKFSSFVPEQRKFKTANINFFSYGITKTLLEKYKPKGHYKIERMSSREGKRREA
tara:strand:- start:2269 stop:2442 length:174 start_codon:yes stop_codon:yes gene_type:complete